MRTRFAVAAVVAALFGFALAQGTRTAIPYPLREVQLAAALRMELALRTLGDHMARRGIPVEAELDPARTGLVGPEWTPLTTTLGVLEAKRTVLNPDFAALLVRYFSEAGLSAGDVVAVGASGSFPGLAIATLCAAREMDLRALTIASFGASMYGATRPELALPAMLRVLSDATVVPDTLIAVSPGSDRDYGASPLFEDSRSLIAGLARETGVEFIDFDPPDLERSIARRLGLYGEHARGKRIGCFVNIGGASPNSGASSATLDFPQGLVLDPPRIPRAADRGLVYEYAARGVPVINLLNVRRLARENGLPYDPLPLPRPGGSEVYLTVRYSVPVLAAVLAAVLGILVAGALERRPGRSTEAERRERAAARRFPMRLMSRRPRPGAGMRDPQSSPEPPKSAMTPMKASA